MTTVSVLTVEHRHGTNVTLHTDHDAAEAAVFDYVKEWWGDEVERGRSPVEMPAIVAEAVEAYFDAAGESYWIEDDVPTPDTPSTRIHDETTGVVYTPTVSPDGHVGYRIDYPDGSVGYLYLNASTGSDDGVSTVFVYEGAAFDPSADEALVHFDVSQPADLDWESSRPLNDETERRLAKRRDAEPEPARVVDGLTVGARYRIGENREVPEPPDGDVFVGKHDGRYEFLIVDQRIDGRYSHFIHESNAASGNVVITDLDGVRVDYWAEQADQLVELVKADGMGLGGPTNWVGVARLVAAEKMTLPRHVKDEFGDRLPLVLAAVGRLYGVFLDEQESTR